MIKCLITGCDLVDPSGRRWCHGDLHVVGTTYVFNACLTPKGETAWQEGDSPMGDKYLTAFEFFERRGVIVVAWIKGVLNEKASEYIRA